MLSIYCIVGIYYESFKFANFAILNTLAKIKTSTLLFGSIYLLYVSPVMDTK